MIIELHYGGSKERCQNPYVAVNHHVDCGVMKKTKSKFGQFGGVWPQ